MSALREIYDLLLTIPANERNAWFVANAVDPLLRDRVQALLNAPVRDTDPLQRPAKERLAVLSFDRGAAAGSDHWLGRSIGPFRLLRLLGQGGMAAVFLAEREGRDFTQQVAVKLLRRGIYSDLELRLFRRERQALASLSHANIARLIDGGITEDGTPFLVMEYVDGMPITHFCRSRRLSVRDRLTLLLSVCRAVDAAHRALIVHRDIKPSNILVSAEGIPKLLDFGIAKLLEDGEDATRTDCGALTPEYAAPEQFCSGRVTTATDVYALGVLLHELLVGERPCPEKPRRASQHVLERTRDLPTMPIAPLTLQRQLRGDLDNIILKALEMEPARRYASAGTLADDLQRHLSGQPVDAHPPSRWYRTRKFVNRHRGSVTVTALLLIGLLLALIGALVQTQRALAANERADTVGRFIISVFESAQPAGPKAPPPTVVEVVERAIDEARNAPHMRSEVRVDLLTALGRVLVGQGRSEQGIDLLREAAAHAERELGANALPFAKTRLELATALIESSQQPEARALLDALRAEGARESADFLPLVLMRSTYLSLLRQERTRGLLDADAAIRSCTRGCSERAELVVRSVATQAWTGFGEDERALNELEALLPRLRAEYGERHSEVMYALGTRARAARHLGRLQLALEAATETDAIAQQTFPAAHWRRAAMSSERLEVQIEMRRYSEADALARQMIDVYERTLGTDHPRYAGALHTLGFLAYQRGNDAEALQLLRRALSATQSAPAPSARRVVLFTRDLGFAHGLNGELDQSRKLLQESISGFMALEPADTTEAAVALSYLATIEFNAGNLDDADHALDRIQTLRSRPEGINPLRLPALATATAVARLQAARGQWDDAARTLNIGIAAMPTPGRYPNEVQIEAQLSRAWIQWHRGNRDDARHAEAQARLELARMPEIATHVRRLAMEVAELSRLDPAVDTRCGRDTLQSHQGHCP